MAAQQAPYREPNSHQRWARPPLDSRTLESSGKDQSASSVCPPSADPRQRVTFPISPQGSFGKHGFGVPVGRWFRTDLKDHVREVLLSPQALGLGYFKEHALRQLIEEHQGGKRDHGHRLWSLLTFEMWHRVFMDQEIMERT
jgi:hypothetical protein